MGNMNKKIALLTPYTGGNLGDAAIQEAVISNIRQRAPQAEIFLITLCPEMTAELHGITSFPITPFAIKNYSPGPSYQLNTGKNSNRSAYHDSKSSPPIPYPKETRFQQFTTKLLCNLKSSARKGRRTWAIAKGELKHIVRSYLVMKQSSILIVSGGGQLDDYWGGAWGHPYALFKWSLLARIAGKKSYF